MTLHDSSLAVEPTAEVSIQPSSIIRTGTSLERVALRVIQLGAVLAALAVVADRDFELDRFFVPKELILHVTALLAGLLVLGSARRLAFTWVDGCLAGYLLIGAASSFLAQNSDLAMRSFTISSSGILLYWVARCLSEAGLARPLLAALAVAAVVGAVTSLVQAYGVETPYFSVNRAPGGTLGNRNFIAHMAAFALPVALVVGLRAWRTAGFAIASVGVALLTASLVLTRSRAGWLAFGVATLVSIGAMLLSRPLRRHRRSWARLGSILLLVAGGAAGALLIPNSLQWRSENPYLESVTGIVNYREGSGAGRLVQYRRSLLMAVDRPFLGVGPGNWSREYPDYAAPGDPSLSRSNPGTTANPWPSSDWVAFVAERGFVAAALLAAAMLGLGAGALRRLLAARDEDEGLLAAALLATLLATIVAGLFDAVLLLALPTLLIWCAMGALSPRIATPDRPLHGRLAALPLVVLSLVSALGAAKSITRLSSMQIIAATEISRPYAGSEARALLDGMPGDRARRI